MDKIEKKTYFFSDDIGDADIEIYTVFPGIQLAYNSVHMERFDLCFDAESTLIEIHHCREGRIEQEFENEFFYLMPGDLSIAIRDRAVDAFNFPLRHYHGITIAIDINVAPKCFSQFLEDVIVQPMEVAKKLCGDDRYFIIRNQSYVEHIFSELYSVPENLKNGYFKIKIMELLLVLSGIDPITENKPQRHSLSRTQTVLAKQAAAYLSENMDQHITIAELAKKHNVSDTYLKKAFKGVYGVPIYSYMRIKKMQAAAQLLIHSDRRIADIAYEFGYSNESKFTAAFKKIVGDTPSEYRKEHKKW